ncbi:peptidase M23 [Micromonospora globispora]|uniref:Peptidase M23 n=1 Tax=Micromonospora globispora TaxID=1450148 RepID=A0A317JV65_9ACTN|nr:M23 family metallopeptidase [Micromonospora globispora]PWU44535.1 peptidase M23 [Micromonospora globispora]
MASGALHFAPAGSDPAAVRRPVHRPAASHRAVPPARASGPVALAGSSAADGRFRWPLAGNPQLVRRFDPPPQPWLPGHRGVDLAAAAGAEVRSAGPGVVLFAGTVAGRPVVTVGHADGLRTTYEPVRPRLPAGARVAAGTPIGTLLAGHPGCPAVACLHWGLRRGTEYLDPLALLGLGPVRLLPLGGRDRGPVTQRRASSVGSRTASRSYSSGVL